MLGGTAPRPNGSGDSAGIVMKPPDEKVRRLCDEAPCAFVPGGDSAGIDPHADGGKA